MKFRALTIGTVATLAATLLASPAEAKPAPVVARSDSAVVQDAASVTVAVLKNDRVKNKAKARVKLVRADSNLAVSKKGKAFVVSAAATAPAGSYRFKYQVRAKTGQKATAWVRVEVKRTVVTPPPTCQTDPSLCPPPPPPPTCETDPSLCPPPPPPPPTDTTSLQARIAALPVAVEYGTGYNRDFFRHWNTGLNSTDGCDTRREVLISEAVTAPTIGASCSFTGGSWFSYYDNVTTTDASTFDIDHMVPLAQAWDSGAYRWDAATRERFANDQGDARSLVAVSASSNRSKGDKDPALWMPAQAQCRYLAEWVAVKTRWQLTVDEAEKQALESKSANCGNPQVLVELAPVTYAP